MIEIELPLIDGKVPLTLNQRLHWREERRRARLVREAVGWAATALKLGCHQHITVQMHFATGDNRGRDADNLIKTQKHAVDGLVDAGLIPNDTPEHITWYQPQIHNGPGTRRLWLSVVADADLEESA